MACLMGTAAHSQTVDKTQPATAASGKSQGTAKSTAAQARSVAPGTAARPAADSGKAKIEGVSTMRSTPADSKKDGGCSHAMASDA
jgi:hypothetical protein